MGWWEGLLCGAGAVYLAVVGWLLIGLRRRWTAAAGGVPTVSVVVAARNEEARIGACLQALRDQDYAGELEVVVVDDRSADATAARVRRFGEQWPRLRLVAVTGPGAFRCPKKNALAAGIAASRGDLLLFTDADCQPLPGWVRAMAGCFAPEVGLVAGHAAPPSAPRLHQRVLALDNLAMGALAAGSLGWRSPLSCTGRNLAYRRSVYDEVGGFDRIGHLIGGDDVYFARLVAVRTRWGLAFCRSADAVVPCDPSPEGWAAVLHQKLRHASKAGHYRGAALGLAVAVYLFHLALLVGLARAAGTGQWAGPFLAVWAARWVADGALLWAFAPRPEDRRLLYSLPALELWYIPYVLLFSVVGRLGWYRWKG